MIDFCCSVAGTKPPQISEQAWSASVHFYFNLNIPQPVDVSQQLLSAKMKVYKATMTREKQHKKRLMRKARISVYQLLEVPSSGRKGRERLLDTREVDLRENDWEVFNVKAAVEHWQRANSTNYGLRLVCEDPILCGHLFFVSGNPHTRNKLLDNLLHTEFRPSLNIFTQEKFVNRMKRRAKKQRRKRRKRGKRGKKMRKDCVSGDGDKRCCRHPMYVSFEEIGWNDWIFEPKGFHAYFCAGKCKLNSSGDLYKPKNMHAKILALMHEQNKKGIPRPCCSPSKYKPLVMGHLNNDPTPKLGVSEHRDMIVEDCACS